MVCYLPVLEYTRVPVLEYRNEYEVDHVIVYYLLEYSIHVYARVLSMVYGTLLHAIECGFRYW